MVVAYRHLEKGDIDHGMDNASARRNLLELRNQFLRERRAQLKLSLNAR
jgi:hypothetical protein